MPTWLTTHFAGLPRWAWASLLVGGLGLGLYLRHHSAGASASGPEPAGYLNTGQLAPPAAPIENAGSGVSSVGGIYSSPPRPVPGEAIPLPERENPETVELPESVPPPEVVVPAPEPTNLPPIARIPPPPEEGSGKDKIKIFPAKEVKQNQTCPAGTQANINNARSEINRLQAEIDGKQNHINQLTDAIQAHPKAAQKGQWERERNEDRSNIDHKRDEVNRFNQVIANGKAQPGCANA